MLLDLEKTPQLSLNQLRKLRKFASIAHVGLIQTNFTRCFNINHHQTQPAMAILLQAPGYIGTQPEPDAVKMYFSCIVSLEEFPGLSTKECCGSGIFFPSHEAPSFSLIQNDHENYADRAFRGNEL